MHKAPKAANRRDVHAAADDDRRGFFGKAEDDEVGGLITVFPFLAWLITFADPLRSRAKACGS